MSSSGANLGGSYPSALETIQGTARARETLAAFFNCEPREVVFGANMTSITCHVARSVARLLTPGDNILVTDLDHDANVTPWVTVAGESGAEVRLALLMSLCQLFAMICIINTHCQSLTRAASHSDTAVSSHNEL